MNLRPHLLFFLVTLNGIDAGATAVMAVLAGPRIEGNPLMKCLLIVSPFLFLVVKVGMGQLLMIFNNKQGKYLLAILVSLVAVYISIDIRTILLLEGSK